MDNILGNVTATNLTNETMNNLTNGTMNYFTNGTGTTAISDPELNKLMLGTILVLQLIILILVLRCRKNKTFIIKRKEL